MPHDPALPSENWTPSHSWKFFPRTFFPPPSSTVLLCLPCDTPFAFCCVVMDEQEFVSLLQTLLLPDTQKVKAATSKLNKTYYTSPASFVALIHIITSHSQSELRQLASVEARKHAKKHWPQAPEGQKAQLRERLLKSTIDDQEALPRHAKARLIAAIASVDLQDGEWPELPGILHQAATSSDVRHREVGLYMIYTLMEEMPDMFQENMAQMLTLLSNTLQDPESTEVKINSMLALAELAMVLDTDEDEASLKAFHGTIPSMVKVLQESIENEDEVHSMQAFDVFNKLVCLGLEARRAVALTADTLAALLRTCVSQPPFRRSPSLLHACCSKVGNRRRNKKSGFKLSHAERSLPQAQGAEPQDWRRHDDNVSASPRRNG